MVVGLRLATSPGGEPRVKPCWQNLGLTEEGARLVDAVFPEVMALVQRVGNTEVIRLALIEAAFRTHSLPQRSPAFRQQYLKDNT